jgi:hypothetical protein
LASDLRCDRYVNGRSLLEWYTNSATNGVNKESLLGLFRILSLEMWMRAFKL